MSDKAATLIATIIFLALATALGGMAVFLINVYLIGIAERGPLPPQADYAVILLALGLTTLLSAWVALATRKFLLRLS